MKVLIVTVLSTVLSAIVISNAYAEKKQFYPTVVFLLNSNRGLSVIYLQAFVMLWFFCKFLKTLFFGTLRAAEVEVTNSLATDNANHDYNDGSNHKIELLIPDILLLGYKAP